MLQGHEHLGVIVRLQIVNEISIAEARFQRDQYLQLDPTSASGIFC
jgi:hypothetical protein